MLSNAGIDFLDPHLSSSLLLQFEQLRCDESLADEMLFPVSNENEGEWIDDEDLIPIDIPAIKVHLYNYSILIE